MSDVVQWLLSSDEPWTRYRTLADLLDRLEGDAKVQALPRAPAPRCFSGINFGYPLVLRIQDCVRQMA